MGGKAGRVHVYIGAWTREQVEEQNRLTLRELRSGAFSYFTKDEPRVRSACNRILMRVQWVTYREDVANRARKSTCPACRRFVEALRSEELAALRADGIGPMPARKRRSREPEQLTLPGVPLEKSSPALAIIEADVDAAMDAGDLHALRSATRALDAFEQGIIAAGAEASSAWLEVRQRAQGGLASLEAREKARIARLNKGPARQRLLRVMDGGQA